MTIPQPSILFLQDITTQPVGGKARGLAQLLQLQLEVPAGFVIQHACAGIYPENLLEAYQQLGGGKVAVRSSALGEDAADHSFAGQFETLLNIEGEVALKAAIDACVHSLQNERAQAYQQDREHEQESTMCVVVQNMVDAKAAGVLFSADPMTGRHDRLVIDAVAGLGEALVSGEASSDHYLLALDNQVIHQHLAGAAAVLSESELKQLASEARDAAAQLGEPLDMEWAIDQSGHLFWLQARPVTTLGSDLVELDTELPEGHVLTRCNIGEMMPGACCPLTFSLQGKGIDNALQHMHVEYGGRVAITPYEWQQVRYSHGQLFIDMTAGLESARYSMLARAETMAQSICGRQIPELKAPSNKKNILRRLWGIWEFVRYLRKAEAIAGEFAKSLRTFYIEYQHNSEAMFAEIANKNFWLTDAMIVHMRSSALSGTMEGVIQAIVSKGNPEPTLDEQAQAAKLFAGAKGVESAVLVEQLDAVVDLIAAHPNGREKFHDVTTAEALAWLQSAQSGSASISFKSFLETHGHRAYKELCLMEPGWVDAPERLVESMQATLMARYQVNTDKPHHDEPLNLNEQPWLIRWLLPKAHAAIRRREYTKSMLVRVTHILKRAYRHLGEQLVAEGRLASPELVFFFTYQELADFVAGKTPGMAEHVKRRKISYAFQERLLFDDIAIGRPQPLEVKAQELEHGQLAGRPVSKGIVEGLVRVAHNVAEAAALQPGEILVAPVTDVGWTPYFSLIAGLITDVGSAVSHGAVIAREYGLPCIVNAQVATATLRTGERIRLDAETGIITRLEV